MDLKDKLLHPVATITVAIGTIGQLGFGALDPFFALVSSTSGLWFPAIATTGATILPEFGYGALGTKILLGSAVVYVGVQLSKLIDRLETWYANR